MKRMFITGTDTNCGKTYATCRILELLKNNNYTCMGLKPIASGCIKRNGRLSHADIEQLQKINNIKAEICAWKFQEAIAPHLAAAANNQTISAAAVADFCWQSHFYADYLLIEGAGGVMVPLNQHETWLDFLKITKIPVILIVGLRLGCINHAFLAERILQQENIACIGWIANCLDPAMLALSDTIDTLQERMTMPLLTTIGYTGSVMQLLKIF